MTTNEAVRLIAEYDGFKSPPKGCTNPVWHNKDRNHVIRDEDLQSCYLTNLNELHRVALGVMDFLKDEFNKTHEVEAYMKIDHIRGNIKLALLKHPVNSQYIDLLLAVSRGIEFINQSKEDTK